MRIEEFWALIHESALGKRIGDARTAWLVAALAVRPAEDLLSFQRHFDEVLARLDTEAMREAVWILCGGLCHKEDMKLVLAWIVGLGRETFERIAADPDALAEVPAVRSLAGRPVREWADDDWPTWFVADRLAYEVKDMLAAAPVDSRWDLPDPAGRGQRLPGLTALFPGPP
jgi:hypothetical protein